MFYKYTSHSLSKLADKFIEEFSTDPENVFKARWVVVQNNEIREWFTLCYARRRGISANFNFILPSEFLWMLYRLKKAEVPHELPGDLDAIQWTLFKLFKENPSLLSKAPYKSGEDANHKQLFQFCGQLADVFDLYQVYRPEMILKWNKSVLSTQSKDEQWQARIWNALQEYWDQHFPSDTYPNRAGALHELIEWIQDDAEFRSVIPKQLYVFGLSQTSEPFLKIITSMSRHSDVRYFGISGNEETGTPYEELLHYWSTGRLDQNQLLDRLIRKKSKKLHNEDLDHEENSRPEILLHSCHNKRREVEVLKDEVLRYLDENGDRGAEDILILVPDAEAYSSTITTVFGQSDGEPAVPVSGLYSGTSDSVEHVVQQILNLLSSNFKVTEVMQLLAMQPVQDKFETGDDELDLIEEWITRNRVYFGIGDSFNNAFSWKKGLSQLMSGFSMETESLDVFRGLVPDKGISTTDQAVLVSKLSGFIYALEQVHQSKEKDKSPVEWLDFVNRITGLFIGESDTYTRSLMQLERSLEKLKHQISFSKFEEEISFELIKPWINGKLEKVSSGSGRFGRGIIVSTYVPYRSVPFDFIAMLGMNEGVFPRQVVRPSFDLINQNPRAGDRILKEDDSYLFAETLQAAGSKLHLSYEGRDQKTDTEKLPSILIQQLKDVAGDKLTTYTHALHSFSIKYFTGERKSYSGEQALIANQIQQPEKNTRMFLEEGFSSGAEVPGEVSIHDVIYFFSNPCKYFLQNELNVSYYDDIRELQDREPFRLRGLDKYQLDQLLFAQIEKKAGENRLLQFAKSAHLVPKALAGEKAFFRQKELVEELWEEVHQYTSSGSRIMEIETEINGITFSGSVPEVYNDKLISVRAGRLKAPDLAVHWIKHLFLLQAGIDISESIFVSKEKKWRQEVIEVTKIQSDSIQQNPLSDYINWFSERDKVQDKLNFFPESSLAYAADFVKTGNHSSAIKRALKEWEPDDFSYGAESEDFYNNLVWRGKSPLQMDSFHDRALRFWTPYLKTQAED